MKAYQPVPSSWYILTLVLSMTAAIILVATSPLQLPIWGLFLAVFIGLIFLVPVGLIRAVSDTSIGLNVITEFVAGYLLPGKPIANVTFKCLGYMTLAQALDLVSDLKLGHYLKIPPRHMFITQLTGTAIGCIVNLAVVQFVLSESSGYRGYLDGSVVDPTGQWDGRKVHIFYSGECLTQSSSKVSSVHRKYFSSDSMFYLSHSTLSFYHLGSHRSSEILRRTVSRLILWFHHRFTLTDLTLDSTQKIWFKNDCLE